MLGHIKNDLINYIGNMDKLYLLQFACFVFMLVSAGYLGLSSLHVHWRNRRFERSRWMLFLALLILGAHYLLQMAMKIRVTGDDLGAVVNMLVYTPCFMLISKAIYCRGDTAVQPPHDGDLLGYLPDYPGCLRHRLLACGQLPHRAVALRHALLLCHRQRVLRGCHPARDVAAPADAGDDGSL